VKQVCKCSFFCMSVQALDMIRQLKETMPRNMRKNFFPLRVTEHWNRLPREAVESASLEIFKTRLDKVLYSLLQVTLLRQEGWTR